MATKSSTINDGGDPAMMSNLAELQKLGFNNLTGFGTAWIEGMGDLGAEVLGFVAERVKEDVNAQHEMLHCKDFTELQKLQSKFLQKAIEQYTAETGKLVEMSNAVITNAVAKGKDGSKT